MIVIIQRIFVNKVEKFIEKQNVVEELLEKIKCGNLSSFDELYAKYNSVLLSFSYGFIHDTNLSQDIVQESFIALWQQKETLPKGTNLKNYIFTIVRNKSISLLREMIKKRTMSIDELTATDYFLSRKLMTLEQMESSVIDIDNIQLKINTIYDSLPDIYKEVFKLSRYENKSNNEISEILNISGKAVEKRMTKVLKIFKNELGNNYFFIYIF